MAINISLQSAQQRQYVFYRRVNKKKCKLDGSLPANPVNDRRVANAVTLKSTFCLPSAIIQKYLIKELPEK